MSEPQLVDPHDVVMTGENTFIRLSNDGGKTIADRVSHWRVLWSPAGQGHALFIESALTGKGPRVYTDNAAVARFLQRTIEVLLYKDFASESLPLIDAEFERTGNCLSTVEERIISDEDEIILSFWDLMAPFVLTMPPGAMDRPIGVYSTFLPARGAQLSVNSNFATLSLNHEGQHTHTGRFNSLAGATIDFTAGTNVLDGTTAPAGVALSGAGTVRFSGSSVNSVSGAISSTRR